MSEYTNEQIEEFRRKAEKWDGLYKAVSRYYLDEKGEYSEDDPEVAGDLTDIGEVAASRLGWL